MSKKHAFKGVFWLAAGIFGFVLVGGLFTPAQATHIDCGAILGPGGHFVLDSDVGPCSTVPAITVMGGATLDMRGFTVSCDPTSGITGILLQGPNAVVKNGVVTGCGNGFGSEGGNNTLTRNLAHENVQGFEVSDNHNKLTHNSAVNNGTHGFDIEGDTNTLNKNFADGNLNQGFHISGISNTLSQNRAVDNADEGFGIVSVFNTLTHNTATSNGNNGFDIESSTNILKHNTATVNGASVVSHK
jgi:parallel beta-helix repeat protein